MTEYIQVTDSDKEECLSMFLQSSMDKVYLHPNGKKLLGSLKILQYRHKMDLSDDVQYVLNPESLTRGMKGHYRKQLLTIDQLHSRIRLQVINILITKKNLDISDWTLRSAYFAVIEPFLKGKPACTTHCQKLLDHIKEECKKLHASGALKLQLNKAQKQSAIRKLRPKLAAAAAAGLEKEDIMELWDNVIVGTVLKD